MPIKPLHENALWEILLRIWTLAIVFFLTPFLIIKLGSHHYGIYVIVMSVTGFMSVLNFGMGEATTRFISHYYGLNDLLGLNRIITSSLIIYLIIGGCGGAILVLFADRIANLFKMEVTDIVLTKDLFHLMGIIFFVECISATFSSVSAAIQRYDIRVKINILQSILQVTGTVVLLYSGYGVYALIILSLCVTVTIQTINLFLAKYLIPNISFHFNQFKKGIAEVFNYSLYSMLSNIFGIIWMQADRLLLGTFIGPNAVAYLSVPQQMVFRGNMLISGACAVLLPRFSTMEIDERIRQLFLTSVFIMLNASIAIFVPMTVMVKNFLHVWISPEFSANSYFIAQIIAGSYIIRGAYFPLQMLLGGINKPSWLAMISLSNASISLTLNIILIPSIGLAGAGYSFLATCLTGLAFMIITWKYLLRNENVNRLYRPVFIPMLLSILSLLVCSLLHYFLALPIGWSNLILECILYVILSLVIVNILEICRLKSDSYISSLFNLVKVHATRNKHMQ